MSPMEKNIHGVATHTFWYNLVKRYQNQLLRNVHDENENEFYSKALRSMERKTHSTGIHARFYLPFGK
ncbi:hypothetical protein RHGRI_001140 [Rhododendron griersonianum]|uniref:Uncharacterized protein n=1 Tax=Rhododendron griersonianum TaxID=479676 RepID=A0AAV6LLL4_9ERIC|nr:hypothetical protein RHGRI_001140 [Rhododendron griersonianum]